MGACNFFQRNQNDTDTFQALDKYHVHSPASEKKFKSCTSPQKVYTDIKNVQKIWTQFLSKVLKLLFRNEVFSIFENSPKINSIFQSCQTFRHGVKQSHFQNLQFKSLYLICKPNVFRAIPVSIGVGKYQIHPLDTLGYKYNHILQLCQHKLEIWDHMYGVHFDTHFLEDTFRNSKKFWILKKVNIILSCSKLIVFMSIQCFQLIFKSWIFQIDFITVLSDKLVTLTILSILFPNSIWKWHYHKAS